MRPSESLAKNRARVLAVIGRYPVSNPRIFGSAARGDDSDGSDLDIVVDPTGPFSYFDLAKMAMELETVLGCTVDVGTRRSLKPEIAVSANREFRPL